jgi:hypothetical protein
VQVDGLSVTEVAAKLGVSRETVHAWLARYEAGVSTRWPTALTARGPAPTSCPRRSRLGRASCAAPIPTGGPVRTDYQLGRDGVVSVPSHMAIWRAGQLPTRRATWPSGAPDNSPPDASSLERKLGS